MCKKLKMLLVKNKKRKRPQYMLNADTVELLEIENPIVKTAFLSFLCVFVNHSLHKSIFFESHTVADGQNTYIYFRFSKNTRLSQRNKYFHICCIYKSFVLKYKSQIFGEEVTPRDSTFTFGY